MTLVLHPSRNWQLAVLCARQPIPQSPSIYVRTYAICYKVISGGKGPNNNGRRSRMRETAKRKGKRKAKADAKRSKRKEKEQQRAKRKKQGQTRKATNKRNKKTTKKKKKGPKRRRQALQMSEKCLTFQLAYSVPFGAFKARPGFWHQEKAPWHHCGLGGLKTIHDFYWCPNVPHMGPLAQPIRILSNSITCSQSERRRAKTHGSFLWNEHWVFSTGLQ